MKISLIVSTLLLKVDSNDYYGFILNDTINKFIMKEIEHTINGVIKI